MTQNNITPVSKKRSNIFTPPPITRKKRDTLDLPSANYDSPNVLVPAFGNDSKENTSHFKTPIKKPLKDTPSQVLALSPERGSTRFRIGDETPKNVGRNDLGLSQHTNKKLDKEYDIPNNSPNSHDQKRKQNIARAQAKRSIQLRDANIRRVMQLTNGGSVSMMNSNGQTVYGLVDKTGKEKLYKYKKSFEKAVSKQDGGFGIFQDLQNQFNSALGITPPKTKHQSRPPAPARPPAPTRSAAPMRGTPPNSKPGSNIDRNCPPTHPYKAPNGINCTNIPPATSPIQQPVLSKIPSKQYKLINGHPELVYEYYIPSTRRKRFLQLKNNNPDKVYDQILEKHVPRLVNNLIGFPRKTLDRATGRFIN